MSIFNINSIFTVVGVFILGAIIYPNPKKKEHLLELGTFCQLASFLITLIYCLVKHNSFVRENSDSYYEFWYIVTLNIYATLINLYTKLYLRFKKQDNISQ